MSSSTPCHSLRSFNTLMYIRSDVYISSTLSCHHLAVSTLPPSGGDRLFSVLVYHLRKYSDIRAVHTEKRRSHLAYKRLKIKVNTIIPNVYKMRYMANMSVIRDMTTFTHKNNRHERMTAIKKPRARRGMWLVYC